MPKKTGELNLINNFIHIKVGVRHFLPSQSVLIWQSFFQLANYFDFLLPRVEKLRSKYQFTVRPAIPAAIKSPLKANMFAQILGRPFADWTQDGH